MKCASCRRELTVAEKNDSDPEELDILCDHCYEAKEDYRVARGLEYYDE